MTMYIINLCKVFVFLWNITMDVKQVSITKRKEKKKKKLIKRSGNLTSEEEQSVSQNSAQIFSPYQRSG